MFPIENRKMFPIENRKMFSTSLRDKADDISSIVLVTRVPSTTTAETTEEAKRIYK